MLFFEWVLHEHIVCFFFFFDIINNSTHITYQKKGFDG